MTPARIEDAAKEFLALIEVLDNAYWEASSMGSKDRIYDVISVFQAEIAELNKLSIQDHGYPYEMVTEGVRQVSPKLHSMQTMIRDLVERTNTQLALKRCLKTVVNIVDQQSKRWKQEAP
ncbi:MAG: hypothetical protein IPM37_06580 [Hahellaceae bacterium]|jgi:hypothetical protein|nr:hypothetical protein [Hahellaceae bacterium]